jgi:hypothetical protein
VAPTSNVYQQHEPRPAACPPTMPYVSAVEAGEFTATRKMVKSE